MHRPKFRAIKVFIAFYALCFVVQAIGGYVTQLSVHDWYVGLQKSALTPPGAAFGIAWSILYILMAIAATRIYLKRNTLHSRSLCWWMIQLLLGLIWTLVFFGNHQVVTGSW